VFELVEQTRQAAVRFAREGHEQDRARLHELLDTLPPPVMLSVVRAFAYFLQFANIAEDTHRARRRRVHEMEGSPPREGTLAFALDAVRTVLGDDAMARERLRAFFADAVPAVLDADALVLLAPRLLAERDMPVIATPHEGELLSLERAFGCEGTGSKPERAVALARASGMVIVAKGPDTVIAAPDGRLACAHRAASWLSTAGTGDVLAGAIASRLATGSEAFRAACEGVWLHGKAARLVGPAFHAGQLAATLAPAYAACL